MSSSISDESLLCEVVGGDESDVPRGVSSVACGGTVQHRLDEADRLRRRLRYFFMNPCEKFQAKRICPWKLVLQIVKIILVTVQLILFGTSRGSHVDFLETSNIAFKHLFLKDWTPTYETMPYPPAMGTFAVYTIPDFYNSVDFTLQQYNSTEELAIGTYHFTHENNTMRPVELCKTHYKKGYIWAFNESYIFDSTQVTECFPMKPVRKPGRDEGFDYYGSGDSEQGGSDSNDEEGELVYNTKQYLSSINETIHFDRLIKIVLKFSLKTIHLKTLTRLDTPDCYQFNIEIEYDNSDHNGQMAVTLRSKEKVLTCHGEVMYKSDEQADAVLLSLFDSLVILVSVLSSCLCCRSLYRAYKLQKVAARWFLKTYPTNPLTASDSMEFVNMWYIMIILNDILTTLGCIVKIQIENKLSNNYEICGVFLSTGNLLVWFGVLRYLGFFKKYNILLLTIKSAAPNVLRFLVCAGLIYLGFAICGWIVLGPYHIKFRELSTSSECLFSLINGDDIFTTFAALQDASTVMWWYSRLYLYVFVSLFIYVILSVFISVIMDTYETIKKYYESGCPKSRLILFAEECHDDPQMLFASKTPKDCGPRCFQWFTSLCSRRPNVSVRCDDSGIRESDDEYTALVR